MEQAKTALLLIDIQNDYLPGGKYELLESEKASLKAKELLAEFRRKNLTVIHVRHESVKQGASFFLPDTPGSDIHVNVAPQSGEIVILKHQQSSFIDTGLENQLRNQGIKHLVIVGMQTNCCVRATTLDALQKDFLVTVIEDAVAARNINVHQEALEEMVKNQARIMKTEELIAVIH